MSSQSKIRKEVSVSNISVSRVYQTEFDKEGTITAELKQTVTTKSYYPTKSVSNSLQDNIFDASDFGFQEQEFESKDTRVAWIAVPIGSTPESVSKQLESFSKANIYKVLSNHPILSEEDKFAIEDPTLEVTKELIAEKQAVRYSKDHEKAGQLVLDINGKIQYRRTAFSKSGHEDIDKRTVNPSDCYLTDVLKAELNGEVHIVEGQSI